jgi:hypothetical protein
MSLAAVYEAPSILLHGTYGLMPEPSLQWVFQQPVMQPAAFPIEILPGT